MADDATESLAKLSMDDEPSTPRKETSTTEPATPPGKRSTPSKPKFSPAPTGGSAVKSTKNPSSLPAPFIVQPSPPHAHAATVIMLPGFTNTGKAFGGGWLPTLRKRLGAEKMGCIKFMWLNAPVRAVSCYGEEKPRLPAWHDYFTDHGGAEGRPEIEEEIDIGHVEWVREQVHAIIDSEASALGGDYGRIAVGGQSQGCCMALDIALTHNRGGELAGVFASFGQVYSCTPIPADRRHMRIHAFHGAADRIIAASLSMRSYAKLVDAGYQQLRVHVEPGLGHSESSDVEGHFFADAMRAWGFFEMVPLAEQARPSLGASRSAAITGEELPTTPMNAPSTPASSSSSAKRTRRGGRGRGGVKPVETESPAAGCASPPGHDGKEDEASGELEIEAAWYGDADALWSEGDGEGRDVTAHVKRLVRHGELRLNPQRASGWYNARFSDTAPGSSKVMAVKFRYGDGDMQQVVSPKRDYERSSLVITPTKCEPKPKRIIEQGGD